MTKTKPAARVIALEEAFLHPALWEQYPEGLKQRYSVVKKRLSDVGPDRLKVMDAAGIDMQVLSHVQPGVQILTDTKLAVQISREVNDWLGNVVRTYPDRFAGFAALPTQSPREAAAELERTVIAHGFKGALINGHTNGHYLDEPMFAPLLEQAQGLDVPIYIHPTDPPTQISAKYYAPYTDRMVPSWGWPVETGTHLLRLICGGIFDQYANLKIIVGHMGELLPYCYARLNIALTMGDWLLSAQEKKAGKRPQGHMKKSFAYYMKHNVYITSSGVFEQPVFDCAVGMLGIDNLMFSVDDPLRDNIEAMEFLADCRLSAQDRERFAHGTAERLLKLPPHQDQPTVRPNRREAFRARLRSRIGRAVIGTLVK